MSLVLCVELPYFYYVLFILISFIINCEVTQSRDLLYYIENLTYSVDFII